MKILLYLLVFNTVVFCTDNIWCNDFCQSHIINKCELMKTKKLISFICNDDHGSLENFTSKQKINEINAFRINYKIENIPINGYLYQKVLTADKLGLFKIFHEANKNSKVKLRIRDNSGFNKDYIWLIFNIHKSSILFEYKTISLLNLGREDEAITCVDDLINAIIITESPAKYVIKFVDFVAIKYNIKIENKIAKYA